jgi:hypothetical protein
MSGWKELSSFRGRSPRKRFPHTEWHREEHAEDWVQMKKVLGRLQRTERTDYEEGQLQRDLNDEVYEGNRKNDPCRVP